MRILLSNDDGLDSPGLKAMEDALVQAGGHEIWVVAPDGERSGMSHSISLKNPIRSRCHGPRRYDVSGSPADAVLTALLGIMEQRPDIVISGINLGPNLGTDITYSGTAAVARQAAYMGVPGVAVSMHSFEGPWYFEPVAKFVAASLDHFVRLFDGHHFVNINAPNSPQAHPPVEITHPCYRMYNDRLVRFTAPRGDDYWFLKGSPIDTSDEAGSDWEAVERGVISVSPVHLHPLNNLVDEEYRTVGFRTGGQQ